MSIDLLIIGALQSLGENPQRAEQEPDVILFSEGCWISGVANEDGSVTISAGSGSTMSVRTFKVSDPTRSECEAAIREAYAALTVG